MNAGWGVGALIAVGVCVAAAQVAPPARGVQDPAWSPDGRRIAFSFLDQIWTAGADGRRGRALRVDSTAVERDPAWSPDGRSLAFAENTGQGFDLVVIGADGRGGRRITTLAGDERWPSWTRDGRLVFSYREADRWRLHVVEAAGGDSRPLFPDTATDDEREARVSPDGSRVAYISDRESEDGESDLWVAELRPGARDRVTRTRIVRARGIEASPSWAPDGSRVAFFAVREGIGSVWVAAVDAAGNGEDDSGPRRLRPAEQPALASRRGGIPAWSPDGRRLAIAELPAPEPGYNGNPRRSTDEPPPLFADAFHLWLVDAPLPVDAGARLMPTGEPPASRLAATFDRVWETLRRLYYANGTAAEEWKRLRDRHRPSAERARDEAALESVIDEMIAAQPLIKPPVVSKRAVVVAGHPLAARAGAMMLEKGGNIVDAAIAASFALGVVEPEASGIGGDGMALLHLKGMPEPIAIDYKDQVPIHATRDNEVLLRNSGDGPAAANIPGVVAGLDLLYRRYASRKLTWAELIAPAIEYAEKGFELDAALPTSIAEGRRYFEKYAASRAIYLPDGRVPRPGAIFVNKDYGATLRAIASEGADTFYRGAIARRIAEDMTRHGGLITLDDLAQYRAVERRPLEGTYREHRVFSAPPPVSTGAALIETLQILQNYRPKAGASYASDADYLHYVVESWKARDQAPRIADPALWDVNLGPHLDPLHAATLFKKIDQAKAMRYGPAAQEFTRPERIGRGTTAFAVADAEGNMIALTQTLSTWGGTFYVSEGLGFLYNNHLRFGGGAAPGRFLPLARSSSTSVPTLVFQRQPGQGPGSPLLAVAAAGNAWIPASVYSIILNVIDGRMPAQKAIEAPRFLIGRDPADPDAARTQIEDRFPRAVLQDLASRGHRFHKIGRKGEVRYGYAAAVVVDASRGEVAGGAEPRRSHAAAAVER